MGGVSIKSLTAKADVQILLPLHVVLGQATPKLQKKERKGGGKGGTIRVRIWVTRSECGRINYLAKIKNVFSSGSHWHNQSAPLSVNIKISIQSLLAVRVQVCNTRQSADACLTDVPLSLLRISALPGLEC